LRGTTIEDSVHRKNYPRRLVEFDSVLSGPPAKGAAVSEPPSVLAQLMDVIIHRKENPSQESYTSRLMTGGVEAIGRKITEEASEVVEAAGESGPQGHEHLVHEAADLMYHLLVMLGHCNVNLTEVQAELARRFGVSGLEEKAARRRADKD